jgi:hypothetical protein
MGEFWKLGDRNSGNSGTDGTFPSISWALGDRGDRRDVSKTLMIFKDVTLYQLASSHDFGRKRGTDGTFPSGLPNTSYWGHQIWNSSWGAVDRQTLQDRRITNVVVDKDHPETSPHNPWPNWGQQ